MIVLQGQFNQPMPPQAMPSTKHRMHRGTNTHLPKGRNHFMMGLSEPSCAAARASFFFMTQKNMIPAVTAPSGRM